MKIFPSQYLAEGFMLRFRPNAILMQMQNGGFIVCDPSEEAFYTRLGFTLITTRVR